MRFKLLLFIALVFNLSFSYAQFSPYNTTYTANFGTTAASFVYSGTSSSVNSLSSSTSTGFLPTPSSGSARVIIPSSATGNAINLSTNNTLEMVSGTTTGGGSGKYTAYSISSSSDLAYCSFNITFNTTSTAGTFAWGLGNYSGTGSLYTGSGSIFRSSSEIFTSLRWTLGSASTITTEYRVGSDASTTTTYSPINTTTFVKGGTYCLKR